MQRAPSGMKGFAVVWIGQFITLLSTAITTFALTLRAYQTTGKAIPLALTGLSGCLSPMIRHVESILPDHDHSPAGGFYTNSHPATRNGIFMVFLSV
ncbi:MAG: hypothetical protein RBR01_07710 [Desulfobacterales bacterium]|jgi:hypothetical protein|nr:hypothetical protein [Desulfobacterales bacterium]MDD3081431.1 hypothetical protein [Desulfobacterales bacterium]MDD3950747.1 hypothetical protein [Desulfobacterales bacterium]MDD4464372.1 hypothetical protein [Desulfobacterales bacterium]MDY0378309.1 hypothetical protein [Desulfobacterales bacterium]